MTTQPDTNSLLSRPPEAFNPAAIFGSDLITQIDTKLLNSPNIVETTQEIVREHHGTILPNHPDEKLPSAETAILVAGGFDQAAARALILTALIAEKFNSSPPGIDTHSDPFFQCLTQVSTHLINSQVNPNLKNLIIDTVNRLLSPADITIDDIYKKTIIDTVKPDFNRQEPRDMISQVMIRLFDGPIYQDKPSPGLNRKQLSVIMAETAIFNLNPQSNLFGQTPTGEPAGLSWTEVNSLSQIPRVEKLLNSFCALEAAEYIGSHQAEINDRGGMTADQLIYRYLRIAQYQLDHSIVGPPTEFHTRVKGRITELAEVFLNSITDQTAMDKLLIDQSLDLPIGFVGKKLPA